VDTLITIRTEEARDAEEVRLVNHRAFGRASEAALVDALRAVAGVTSLVATAEGRVVGHILFSPVQVEGLEPGVAAGLAPMAVLPEYQRQGVGSQLVRAGLDACLNQGHQVVVVLGHPGFYSRFGFVPASTKGIAYEELVPPEAFMVLELQDGALGHMCGLVRYRPEFAKV
jgi:putative acetyltransferase